MERGSVLLEELGKAQEAASFHLSSVKIEDNALIAKASQRKYKKKKKKDTA